MRRLKGGEEGEREGEGDRDRERDSFSFTSFGSQGHGDPESVYFLSESTAYVLRIMG